MLDSTIPTPFRDLGTLRARPLASYLGSKDNNFNLLRIVAAFMVLVSHSFVLATGNSADEPFRTEVGMTLGDLAVNIFFVASGFLVSGSLVARGSLSRFLRARALRVYPGLAVTILVTVFVVGPLVTTLPFWGYITSVETIEYLFRNISLIFGVSHTLPGVFEHNPWNHGINSSLWTLPYEIAMYASLTAFWFLLSPSGRPAPHRFERAVLAIAGTSLMASVALHYLWRDSALIRLTAMFWLGASYYTLRNRVILSMRGCLAGTALLLLTTLHREAFFFGYMLILPYLVLCYAYLPQGAVRRYNQIGDYSYGVYLYAFLIQQVLANFIPGIDVKTMIVLASLLTLAAAVLSWHCVERRAMSFK